MEQCKLFYFHSHLMRCHSKIVVVLLCLLPVSLAQAVNYTIDDSFGDSRTGVVPTFLPMGVWDDQTCGGCAIKPDVSQAFMNTYTAATYNPNLGNISISMGFRGTAIYVFFTLPNNQGDGITTITVADFTIDGSLAGHFIHEPDESTTEILYKQMVFSATDLSNDDHQLVILTTGVSSNTFTNFDYAMYTLDNTIVPPNVPGTTTSSSTEGVPTVSANTTQPSPPDEDRSTSSTISLVTTSSSAASTLSSSTTQPSSSSFQSTAGQTSTFSSTLQLVLNTIIQSKTSSPTSEFSSTSSSSSSSVTAAADNNNHSHSNTTMVAAIAGGVSGVVVLISSVAALLLWRRWRARKIQLGTPIYGAVELRATRASSFFSSPNLSDNPSERPSSPGCYQPATLPDPESLSYRGSVASASIYSQSVSTQTEARSPDTHSNVLEQRFNEEMGALSAGATSYPSLVSNSAWNDSASEMVVSAEEMNEMGERMQEMQQSRVQLLQLLQQVPDEPPPYYTP